MKIVRCDKCRELLRQQEWEVRCSSEHVEIDGKPFVLCSECLDLSNEDLWKWAKDGGSS